MGPLLLQLCLHHTDTSSRNRICPGLQLAESSVFLTVAAVCYVYDILKAKDVTGADIELEVDYDGFIWYASHLVYSTTAEGSDFDARGLVSSVAAQSLLNAGLSLARRAPSSLYYEKYRMMMHHEQRIPLANPVRPLELTE